MIARVRQRQTFQRLTREGARIRRSTLWCTWCPQPDSTQPGRPAGAAVAFSIGRAVGPAVTRNRLRRRLRAILRELDAASPLPPVTMLIGASPAAAKLTFAQMRHEVEQLVAQVRGETASMRSP